MPPVSTSTAPGGPRPIDRTVRTAADPETAWRTITEPERIVLWFSDASPLGPVGSPYRIDFGDGSVATGTVVAVEPGRRFVHTWSWEGIEPAEVTRVEWSVEPLPEGGSLVRLVHDGWETAGGETARDEHDGYWAGYLEDLADVLGDG